MAQNLDQNTHFLYYSVYRIHASARTSECLVAQRFTSQVNFAEPVIVAMHTILGLLKIAQDQGTSVEQYQENFAAFNVNVYLPQGEAIAREHIAKEANEQLNVADEFPGLTSMDISKPLSDYIKNRRSLHVWVLIEDKLFSETLDYAVVKMSKTGTFTEADVRANNIRLVSLHDVSPEVLQFLKEMSKKRKIGVEAYETIAALNNPPANLKEYLEKGDECGTELGQNKPSIEDEGYHYFHVLRMAKRCKSLYSDGARESTIDNMFYFPVALTLQSREDIGAHDKPYINFSSPWPHSFHLPCKTPTCGPNKYVKYTPISDNCLWRGFQPLWLSETFSDPGNDWFELLVQGASLVRLFNFENPCKQTFFIPVIYVDEGFTAQIVYMYPSGKEVLYYLKTYNLVSQEEVLEFTVVLYNLGDRKALWSEHGQQTLQSKLKHISYCGSLTDYKKSSQPSGEGEGYEGGDGGDGGGEGGGGGDGGRSRKRPRESRDSSDAASGEPSSKRTAAPGGGGCEAQDPDVLARRGYTLDGVLSSELFGMSKVYNAWSESRNKCVVKVIAKTSREIDFLRLCSDLKAPNIIHFREIIPADQWTYVVFPFLSVLAHFFVSGAIYQISDHLCSMSVDLARGLSFLHSKNIAHLDINTRNLVFDKSMRLLIIDLGIAMEVKSEEETIIGVCGTEGWMAPEIDRGKAFSPIRADRFSCGLVFQSMAICAGDAAPGLEEFSERLRDEEPSKRPALIEWVDQWSNLPLSPEL